MNIIFIAFIGYINTGAPSLKHQRAPNQVETSSTACQIKGIIESQQVTTKFRKGACENCGAMTHKTKECVDRPRKVGAKYTGSDLKSDEFLVEGPQDFDGKRDRWASYDPSEYEQVVKNYEKIEEERRKLKEAEAEADIKKGVTNESEKLDEKEEEEKYAEAVDMPGQKVDTKTRMTVRNLRIREDTAKYLRNLDIDSAYYDPKTRSMRENPNQDEDPDKLTYAGDNFVRSSGDSSKITELQVFAWQAYERGEDISLQANPSEVERLYRENTKKKEQEKRKLEESLLARYGNQDELVAQDEGAAIEESDVYIEYSKTGKVVKTKHSKYNY
jgi:pre-mRNA-processing factor SLU7